MNNKDLSLELRALAARLLQLAGPDGGLNLKPGAWALGDWVFTPARSTQPLDGSPRTGPPAECP